MTRAIGKSRGAGAAIACLALLGLASGLAGCGGAMGLGVGVVTRAAGTGDAYSAWAAKAPPIPAGSGRLVVYAPNRQVSVWTADWATGGEFVFDIDRDVCDVIGASFAYVDLPAGAHSLSASDVKKFPGGFQIGKYATTVRIAAGRTTSPASSRSRARRESSPSAGRRCGSSRSGARPPRANSRPSPSTPTSPPSPASRGRRRIEGPDGRLTGRRRAGGRPHPPASAGFGAGLGSASLRRRSRARFGMTAIVTTGG